MVPKIGAGGFDEQWKQVTEKANNAFAEQRFGDAAGLYRSAVSEARRVFDGSSAGTGANAEHAVPMIVVSAVNSAQNYRYLGELMALENEFESAAKIFVATLSDANRPRALRDACARHLPRLLSEYRSLVGELGLDASRFNACFHKSRTAALQYVKETQPTH